MLLRMGTDAIMAFQLLPIQILYPTSDATSTATLKTMKNTELPTLRQCEGVAVIRIACHMGGYPSLVLESIRQHSKE
jgi:hypothetical protein